MSAVKNKTTALLVCDRVAQKDSRNKKDNVVLEHRRESSFRGKTAIKFDRGVEMYQFEGVKCRWSTLTQFNTDS